MVGNAINVSNNGHRKRLKERFLKDCGKSMADYELLEMLLFNSLPRGDAKPLAKALIAEFGDLAHVISARPEELRAIKGMGDSSISALKVVQEASVRLLNINIKDKPVLKSWKALLDYCRATMAYNKTEQVRVFYLDRKLKMISDELQQQGTVDHTPIYPREVIKRALDLGASALILAHNHPSGDPSPSKADIEMTRNIMRAAAALNIDVHDHLIIGGKKHYSFASNGLL